MKTSIRWTWLPILFLLAWCAPSASAQQFSPTEDLNMMPEKATEVLKAHWTFLRDETEKFFKAIEKRGEFETDEMFTQRTAAERRSFNGKVDAYIKEHKINRRMFGVLLKANLVSYDANAGVYEVAAPTSVELPYDIPTLISTIPSNEYVGLKDTTQGGYRMSKLYLKFDPSFKWEVPLEMARAAKANEGNIYFKFRFVLDLSQTEITDKAFIRILPVDLRLVDQNARKQYWIQHLR